MASHQTQPKDQHQPDVHYSVPPQITIDMENRMKVSILSDLQKMIEHSSDGFEKQLAEQGQDIAFDFARLEGALEKLVKEFGEVREAAAEAQAFPIAAKENKSNNLTSSVMSSSKMPAEVKRILNRKVEVLDFENVKKQVA